MTSDKDLDRSRLPTVDAQAGPQTALQVWAGEEQRPSIPPGSAESGPERKGESAWLARVCQAITSPSTVLQRRMAWRSCGQVASPRHPRADCRTVTPSRLPVVHVQVQVPLLTRGRCSSGGRRRDPSLCRESAECGLSVLPHRPKTRSVRPRATAYSDPRRPEIARLFCCSPNQPPRPGLTPLSRLPRSRSLSRVTAHVDLPALTLHKSTVPTFPSFPSFGSPISLLSASSCNWTLAPNSTSNLGQFGRLPPELVIFTPQCLLVPETEWLPLQ